MKVHRVLLAGACFLGVIAIGVAGDDTAKKLVGVWTVIQKEKKEGALEVAVEFTKDGKYIMNTKLGDKERKDEGTYKLKGDMLSVTFGKRTQTAKITKLTEKELVVTDEDGTHEFRRLK
jgi:uncharacterized protein (TIGR03066 family)